jgi:hypothetical protein
MFEVFCLDCCHGIWVLIYVEVGFLSGVLLSVTLRTSS